MREARNGESRYSNLCYFNERPSQTLGISTTITISKAENESFAKNLSF